ncbi:MAG: 4Fe-4S dicluster domain-containing protein [Chitinophagales bacterium]
MGNKMSNVTEEEAFRDSISTVDKSGKRNWIYPKMQKGQFYKYRTYVSFVLLALLFGMPFVKVNGQPLLLFNILERKFIIFGLTFWPQDFHLFVLAMLVGIVCIVLFTVVYGRLFCGWACPQTIFMEMVFRKIEYWIEGDATKQKLLTNAPWSSEKLKKRIAKHSIFYVIAFLISNTFLAYIIGIDELFKIITDPPSQHITGLSLILLFSFVFFFVFAYMREQICLVVCPYGRLQGVMLDRDSIVVHYDFERGEPRGKIKKKKETSTPTAKKPSHQAFKIGADGVELQSQAAIAEPELGDCIDCGLCVRVCPTGIDIRNGTQLECINCTACIDACDEIMEKVDRPKGLIRYASYNNIVDKTQFRFTPRIIAYTSVLVILATVLTFFLATRSDFETTILRAAGVMYQEVDENTLSNLYNVEMVNKTIKELPVSFKITSPPNAILKLIGQKQSLVVPEQGIEKGAFFIELPKSEVKGHKNKVVIEVYSGERLIDRVKTNFVGPIK